MNKERSLLLDDFVKKGSDTVVARIKSIGPKFGFACVDDLDDILFGKKSFTNQDVFKLLKEIFIPSKDYFLIGELVQADGGLQLWNVTKVICPCEEDQQKLIGLGLGLLIVTPEERTAHV